MCVLPFLSLIMSNIYCAIEGKKVLRFLLILNQFQRRTGKRGGGGVARVAKFHAGTTKSSPYCCDSKKKKNTINTLVETLKKERDHEECSLPGGAMAIRRAQ